MNLNAFFRHRIIFYTVLVLLDSLFFRLSDLWLFCLAAASVIAMCEGAFRLFGVSRATPTNEKGQAAGFERIYRLRTILFSMALGSIVIFTPTPDPAQILLTSFVVLIASEATFRLTRVLLRPRQQSL